MASIFVNAATARTDSRNTSIIHDEVRSIESAVLANISAGVLYANVSTDTVMTSSNVYYLVNMGAVTDPTKKDQLDYVKKYFTDLGYGVSIGTNPSTLNTIVWNISW